MAFDFEVVQRESRFFKRFVVNSRITGTNKIAATNSGTEYFKVFPIYGGCPGWSSEPVAAEVASDDAFDETLDETAFEDEAGFEEVVTCDEAVWLEHSGTLDGMLSNSLGINTVTVVMPCQTTDISGCDVTRNNNTA